MPTKLIKHIGLSLTAFCLLSGCKHGASSSTVIPDAQGMPGSNRPASQAASSAAMTMSDLSSGSNGPNRCALLTDDEVKDSIGAHGAGVNAPGSGWGLQSCRWTAINGKDGTDSDSIFTSDWIEVGVFNPGGIGENASWAREQVEGDPVKGFVDGARYDSSSGDLWFECGHDRFCVVEAHIGSGEPRRAQTARHLAELVLKRLS